MTTDLARWVAHRIDESGVSDEVGLVVLAALEGDDDLDRELSGGTTASNRSTVVSENEGVPLGPSSGTFLGTLSVKGFRGIGAEVVVPLTPIPGLTIIAGRNGSGKSSLAEALELLLTGGTYRWQKRSALWRERWRNLHLPGSASVSVQLVREGGGPTTLCTTWADDAEDVDKRLTWAQQQGQRRVNGDDPLGWSRPLETYRPMLSYDEFGGLLEAGPSQLYDALSAVLGVEQLADALKRIQVRHKTAKEPGLLLDRRRRELMERAGSVSDERAGRLATLLKSKAPDATAIADLVTGAEPTTTGPIAGLQDLVHLPEPDPVVVDRAARGLRRAVAGLARVGETTSRLRKDRLELRRAALQAHRTHGDMPCPVCAATTLDESWAETSRDLVAREDEALAVLNHAVAELDSARTVARRQLVVRPRALDRSPTPGLEDAVALAREVWDTFAAAPPDDDLDLADHLGSGSADLAATLDLVRAQASAELRALDDVWSPLATEAAAWTEEWAAWHSQAEARALLAGAESWLRTNDAVLKNERMAPIADGARQAWARLRQDSNVELGELRLEGAANRRRVEIGALVDGVDVGAISVMSQGELHALALSLFLPRARMDASPFRFIVLDDPVQAMDPAKVEGLVELLGEAARTHQVIVLSHDDRLPAAVRRSQVTARVLEVSRGSGSEVSLRDGYDPATRFFNDARALVRDAELPPEVLRRTLPGLLRMAVEAAARDTLFAARLAQGEQLADLEDLWSRHHTTRDRVSLAVYDEVKSLDGWLRAPYRKKALGCITSGMHQGLAVHTDPDDAVYDTGRMLSDVRDRLR